MKPSLCEPTLEELQTVCREYGVPAYRANQIWRWLYTANAATWDDMANLPAALRQTLANRFSLEAGIVEGRAEDRTATGKLLIALADGERIETALIPAADRLTVCLSTQVGCRRHCAFCASGQRGFGRNLALGEIVSQFRLAWRAAGRKPTHAVFMGIGEPLDNIEATLGAARRLNDADGFCLAARRITVSTCGVVPGIARLAGEAQPIELSVSLHAPDDALRSQLMPINRLYPLATLFPACRDYAQRTKRIVTFEYTLIRDINDSAVQAKTLARRLQTLPARVNLIPLSPVPEYAGRPATAETERMFVETLREHGINATVRRSRGSALNAACGQLRAQAGTGVRPGRQSVSIMDAPASRPAPSQK